MCVFCDMDKGIDFWLRGDLEDKRFDFLFTWTGRRQDGR